MLCCLPLAGCSLFTMGAKMFFGDPLTECEFKTFTHVDLTKGKHKLMVVCSTPTAVDADMSTLELDLVDSITRKLKVHKIQVLEPDKLAAWMDDHGGLPSDPSELARDFLDVDYIAWIQVDEFVIHEENSTDLLRGKASGLVRVFKVAELDKIRMTNSVFSKEFSTIFPPHGPISEVSHSAEIFRREFTHRVAEQLAHKFYDDTSGWDI